MVCEFGDHRQAGFLLLSGFPSLPHSAICLGPQQQLKGRAEKSGERGPGFAPDKAWVTCANMCLSLGPSVHSALVGVDRVMSGFLGSDGLESEGFMLSAGTWDLHLWEHKVSPQQLSVFKLLVPVPAGESATIHEFGLCGLNWLPHFADKEVEV